MSIEEITQLLSGTQWMDQYGNVYEYYVRDKKFYYRTTPTNETQLRNCRIDNGKLICTNGYGLNNDIIMVISVDLKQMLLRNTATSINISDRILNRI